MAGKNFETLYVIPTECPEKELISTSHAFGKQTIKQETFAALFPKRKNLEYKINSGLYVSWTCAGCTKSMGSKEEACPKRMCTLGGKKI